MDPGNVFVISLSDDVFEIKTKYHSFIVIHLQRFSLLPFNFQPNLIEANKVKES